MKLTVIVPCFNERNTVEELLARVWNCSHEDKEVIIVDDCSSDGTREILKQISTRAGELLIFHDKNMGKGAAIQSAIDAASGDIIIIQDADLEYNPNEIPKVIQPIVDGRADVVFGSRFSGGEAHRVLYFWHRIANGILTLASNIFTGLNLSDMETCYKAFKSEILQEIKIEEPRFGFEPEITAKIAKIPGIRVYEVGISYCGRTYAEGKKIGFKDAVRAVIAIIKYNLFR